MAPGGAAVSPPRLGFSERRDDHPGLSQTAVHVCECVCVSGASARQCLCATWAFLLVPGCTGRTSARVQAALCPPVQSFLLRCMEPPKATCPLRLNHLRLVFPKPAWPGHHLPRGRRRLLLRCLAGQKGMVQDAVRLWRRSSRRALPGPARPGMRLPELRAGAVQGEHCAGPWGPFVSLGTCALLGAPGLGLPGVEPGGSNPLRVRGCWAAYSGNPHAGPRPCHLACSLPCLLGPELGREAWLVHPSPSSPGAQGHQLV